MLGFVGRCFGSSQLDPATAPNEQPLVSTVAEIPALAPTQAITPLASPALPLLQLKPKSSSFRASRLGMPIPALAPAAVAPAGLEAAPASGIASNRMETFQSGDILFDEMPKIVTICRIPIPVASLDGLRVGHMQVTRQNHFSKIYHGDLVEKSVAGSLAQDVAWSKLVCQPVGEDLDAFVLDIVDSVTNGLVWKHVAPVPREYDTPKPKSIDQEYDGFGELETKRSRQMTKGLASVQTSIRSSDPTSRSPTSKRVHSSCRLQRMSLPGPETSDLARRLNSEDSMREMHCASWIMAPGKSSTSNVIPGQSLTSNVIPGHSSTSNTIHGQSSSLNVIPGHSSTSNVIHGQSSASNVIHGQSSTSNVIHGQSSTSNVIHVQSLTSNAISGQSSNSAGISHNSNATSGRSTIYKSRSSGPGAKANPKTESMLHPVRGDHSRRPMLLESGRGVELPRTASEVVVSSVCFEGENDSNTSVPVRASTSSNIITGSSNCGKSSLAIVPYPHSDAGAYELPDKLPEEQPEDIPAEPPIVWIEVTIKCVTDHEKGMCSLMIIQDDVSERENAQVRLCNLTEAQLTIMAETFPRHIIDFFYVFTTDEAPKHVGALASSHQDVTIMFMDIVGFTAMCKEVQAADVLTFLNQLFTPFDHMCNTHDIQKVETAGDCYIVAAGIIEKESETGFYNILEEHDPVDSATKTHDPVHIATKVLAFAKSMLTHSKTVVMPHNQQPVVIRIGLHTGPCVSGLIGAKLPKFSIFGDTMNTASRMESTCKPSFIQVSEHTRELLVAGGNNDPWESTPGVEIRGKGLMDTFILEPRDLDLDGKTICKRISTSSPGARPLCSLVLLAKTISRPNGSSNLPHRHSLEPPTVRL
eukprot:gene1305-32655_t